MIVSRFHPPQRLILSILVLSGICSKLLHIYQHSGSIPWYLILLYFPTFFILETLLFVAVWGVLHLTTGWYAVLAMIGSGILA